MTHRLQPPVIAAILLLVLGGLLLTIATASPPATAPPRLVATTNLGILFEVMDRDVAAQTVLEMLEGIGYAARRDALVDLGGFSAPSMFRGDLSLRLLPVWRVESSYAAGALGTLQRAGLSAAVPTSTEMMLNAELLLRAGTPPSSLIAAALFGAGDPAESPYTGQARIALRTESIEPSGWYLTGAPGTAATSLLPIGGFEPAASDEDVEPPAARAWARIAHDGGTALEVTDASLQSKWPAVMQTTLSSADALDLAPVTLPPATANRIFAALQPRFATELPPVTFQLRPAQLRFYQQYIRHVDVPESLRVPGMTEDEAWAEVSWVQVRALPNPDEERAHALIRVERAPLAARFSRQPLLIEAELQRHSDTGAYSVKVRQGPAFVAGALDGAFLDNLTQGQRLMPEAFLEKISTLGSARQYFMPIYMGMILLDLAIAEEQAMETDELEAPNDVQAP